MENQANSKNIILNYGLYYGLIVVFTNLLLYAAAMHLTTTGGTYKYRSLGICLILFIIGN